MDNYVVPIDILPDDDADELAHYGTRHEGNIPHSGRYEWGSGKKPNQHATSFLAVYRSLLSEGLSEKEIADYFHKERKELGITNTSTLRSKVSVDTMKERKIKLDQAYALRDKGLGPSAIAREMTKTLGYEVNESAVRGWLKPTAKRNNESLQNTADILEKAIKKQTYVDVGKGVEIHMGISADKLKKAIDMLQATGKYELRNDLHVPQIANPNQHTILRVLVPKGTTTADILANKDKIRMPNDQTEDNGLTYAPKEPIKNIDASRVYIRYAEEGGVDRDGVIQLRRGVEDMNLGQAHYAQVRIGVKGDKTEDNPNGLYYLKGMAMYSNDIPEGYDCVFNTNKHVGAPHSKVFKEQKLGKDKLPEDPSNPFGSALAPEEQLIYIQRHYVDKKGERQLSALNVCREEGMWDKWSKSLASQFLSKQPIELAKQQLGLDATYRRNEYEKLLGYSNPTIKKELLIDFADTCDSAAVDLKAAALPRQRTKVFLPFPSLKPDECYCPGYKDGETIILVRYPHEGTFQIPELKNNLRCKEAIDILGKNPIDAIGIHPDAAATMSGADFDGDAGLSIPTAGLTIRSEKNLTKAERKAIESLRTFDNKAEFPYREGMKSMGKKGGSLEHKEMGIASNLITDMTLQNAPIEELVRATKYSMTVIDAAKHKLDYKKAYNDLGIRELQRKWQPKANGSFGGASTLISKASGTIWGSKRKEIGIDPETGEKKYLIQPDIYSKKVTNKDGTVTWKQVEKKRQYTNMGEAKDARSLILGHPMEAVYADYANYMKKLANEARKSALEAGRQEMPKIPGAAKTFEKQVNSLMQKLADAKANKPYERRAQLLANKTMELKKHDAKMRGEELSAEEIKKIRNSALRDARIISGAAKHQIYITDDEWEAIQKGAIAKTTLTEIWKNADQERAKSLAMPKEERVTPPSVVARIKAMSGRFNTSEIAEALGVSVSTVNKYIKGDE